MRPLCSPEHQPAVNRLVRPVGVEPTRPRGHQALDLARLPFRHERTELVGVGNFEIPASRSQAECSAPELHPVNVVLFVPATPLSQPTSRPCMRRSDNHRLRTSSMFRVVAPGSPCRPASSAGDIHGRAPGTSTVPPSAALRSRTTLCGRPSWSCQRGRSEGLPRTRRGGTGRWHEATRPVASRDIDAGTHSAARDPRMAPRWMLLRFGCQGWCRATVCGVRARDPPVERLGSVYESLVDPAGIEPASPGCKPGIFPLDYEPTKFASCVYATYSLVNEPTARRTTAGAPTWRGRLVSIEARGVQSPAASRMHARSHLAQGLGVEPRTRGFGVLAAPGAPCLKH